MDGPMIGAGASIVLDAITERESGRTPPPPPVSVKTLAIALALMFVVGCIGFGVVFWWQDTHPPLAYRLSYGADGSGFVDGYLDGIAGNVMEIVPQSEVLGQGDGADVEIVYDRSTLFRRNGMAVRPDKSVPGTGTVQDFTSSACRVYYDRVKGSLKPRAVRVEFLKAF